MKGNLDGANPTLLRYNVKGVNDYYGMHCLMSNPPTPHPTLTARQEHDQDKHDQLLHSGDDQSGGDAATGDIRVQAVGESPSSNRVVLPTDDSPTTKPNGVVGSDNGSDTHRRDHCEQADGGDSVVVPDAGSSTLAIPGGEANQLEGGPDGGEAASSPEVAGEDAPQVGRQGRADEQGEPLELPLSEADIVQFERDGFIMLKGAFDQTVASACR